MKKNKFGVLSGGKEVFEIQLENSCGMRANVISYGAIVKSLEVPDRNGRNADIILGQDTLKEFVENPSASAAVIGRVANRIKDGRFQLNGITYQLEQNEGGNCLHSGSANYGLKNFSVADGGKNWVLLHLKDCGEGGFPGNAFIEVLYRLTDENTFELEYQFVPDEDTPVNLTNHAYFNLSGGEDTTIQKHEMQLNADFYTPIDENLATTGEILRVQGTQFDFKQRRVLGDVLRENLGLDYNFIVNGEGQRLAGQLWHEKSGRKMEVYTDCPGIQVYTGNHFDGSQKGKSDRYYSRYAGICFETQQIPNAVNYNHFPSCVIKKNTVFTSRTVYRFSTV